MEDNGEKVVRSEEISEDQTLTATIAHTYLTKDKIEEMNEYSTLDLSDFEPLDVGLAKKASKLNGWQPSSLPPFKASLTGVEITNYTPNDDIIAAGNKRIINYLFINPTF